MKNLLRGAILAAALAALLTGTALAAEDPPTGIYGLTISESTVSIQPKTADGAVIDSEPVTIDGETVQLFSNAERLSLTVNSAQDEAYYLALVLKGEPDLPTTSLNESDIVYINQETAAGGMAEFDLYPTALTTGQTYSIYCSSSANEDSAITTAARVATFQYITRQPSFTGTDSEALARAKEAIPATLTFQQGFGDPYGKTYFESVVPPLLEGIVGATDTGVTVGEVSIPNFDAASNGDRQNPDGTEGSFSFSVTLSKGSETPVTASGRGVILPYSYDTNTALVEDALTAAFNWDSYTLTKSEWENPDRETTRASLARQVNDVLQAAGFTLTAGPNDITITPEGTSGHGTAFFNLSLTAGEVTNSWEEFMPNERRDCLVSWVVENQVTPNLTNDTVSGYPAAGAEVTGLNVANGTDVTVTVYAVSDDAAAVATALTLPAATTEQLTGGTVSETTLITAQGTVTLPTDTVREIQTVTGEALQVVVSAADDLLLLKRQLPAQPDVAAAVQVTFRDGDGNPVEVESLSEPFTVSLAYEAAQVSDPVVLQVSVDENNVRSYSRVSVLSQDGGTLSFRTRSAGQFVVVSRAYANGLGIGVVGYGNARSAPALTLVVQQTTGSGAAKIYDVAVKNATEDTFYFAQIRNSTTGATVYSYARATSQNGAVIPVQAGSTVVVYEVSENSLTFNTANIPSNQITGFGNWDESET